MNFGEDTIFVFSYLKKCNSLITTNDVGYNDMIISNTLSRKANNNYGNDIKKIMIIFENRFLEKYSKEWNFLVVRNLKLFLLTQNSLRKNEIYHYFGDDIKKVKIMVY